MSWESIVRDMIEEDNPDLHFELLDEGVQYYEDYVADVTKRMVDSYEHATKNETDPTRMATAKEVAIAQAREEITPPEVPGWGDISEEEALEFLIDFHYGGSV